MSGLLSGICSILSNRILESLDTFTARVSVNSTTQEAKFTQENFAILVGLVDTNEFSGEVFRSASDSGPCL